MERKIDLGTEVFILVFEEDAVVNTNQNTGDEKCLIEIIDIN